MYHIAFGLHYQHIALALAHQLYYFSGRFFRHIYAQQFHRLVALPVNFFDDYLGLADLQQADCLLLIGANPASNHPRFIHQLTALRERGGDVIVINPAREPGLVRFAVPKSAKSMLSGGSWIASDYLQPRIGGDIALLKGLAKAVLQRGAADKAFIGAHTADFDAFCADIDATDWPSIVAKSGLPREAIERRRPAVGPLGDRMIEE